MAGFFVAQNLIANFIFTDFKISEVKMKSGINSYNPNFQANVSKGFVNSANVYYRKLNAGDKLEKFMKKVDAFKHYDTDDVNIVYDKVFLNGKAQHVLYSIKKGMKPGEYVVLSIKDQFRKLLEKFLYISEYEYTMKMSQQSKLK